jgi:hypothetical protein
LLIPLVLGSVSVLGTEPSCTRQTVRTVKSASHVEAIEEMRICSQSRFIVTGHNEVLLRSAGRGVGVPLLVARLDSVGRKGVPLSWTGKTLLIHVPKGSHPVVLRREVNGISVRIVEDYTDEQQLRDSRK